MAGNPADLTIYADVDVNHNHTYYGNGCQASWGESGEGGSKTPCSSNKASTDDGDEQKIGAYYNYQAATSGSGPATLDNKDVSDTFCPLGWQLPYDGTGGDYYDKSWGKIIQLYQDAGGHSGPTMRSYPISIIPSGEFIWRLGMLYYQNMRGVFWSGIKARYENANAVIFFKTSDPTFSENYFPTGNTLRCVLGISILEMLSMASA